MQIQAIMKKSHMRSIFSTESDQTLSSGFEIRSSRRILQIMQISEHFFMVESIPADLQIGLGDLPGRALQC